MGMGEGILEAVVVNHTDFRADSLGVVMSFSMAVYFPVVFENGAGKRSSRIKDLFPIPPKEAITEQGNNARFVGNYQLIRAN